MTYSDFYNKLAQLTVTPPNFEIAQLILQLQLELDKITDSENQPEFMELMEHFI